MEDGEDLICSEFEFRTMRLKWSDVNNVYSTIPQI